jgi:hypothetical protein
MNPADFLAQLETALQSRGTPFSRAALIAFVDSCWPWILDNPDVELWAAKFLRSTDLTSPD